LLRRIGPAGRTDRGLGRSITTSATPRICPRDWIKLTTGSCDFSVTAPTYKLSKHRWRFLSLPQTCLSGGIGTAKAEDLLRQRDHHVREIRDRGAWPGVADFPLYALAVGIREICARTPGAHNPARPVPASNTGGHRSIRPQRQSGTSREPKWMTGGARYRVFPRRLVRQVQHTAFPSDLAQSLASPLTLGQLAALSIGDLMVYVV